MQREAISVTDVAKRFAAVIAVLFLVLAPVASFAATTTYPALTGRVVDAANLLSATTKQNLEAKLKDLEDKSQIQLVVATVTSLDGQEIEPYANTLFRQWQLGQKGKDNGVLLLVAPKEHRVRIEVGYGLEGTLTDAISKIIIANAITPKFKAGDFNSGITRGVDDIITVLTSDSGAWQPKPEILASDNQSAVDAIMPFLVFGFFVLIFISILRGGILGQIALAILLSGGRNNRSSGGNGFGSGLSGGGFSGGGGSSGGGGASGGW